MYDVVDEERDLKNPFFLINSDEDEEEEEREAEADVEAEAEAEGLLANGSLPSSFNRSCRISSRSC